MRWPTENPRTMNTVDETTGRATPQGTHAFVDRSQREHGIPPSNFREAKGLRLGSLGVGTYLGKANPETDHEVEEAIVASLRSGAVNVLDTAINYRSQRAERSVGRALARAVQEGIASREELFVSTKNGYLAPDAESDLSPREYIQRELIGTGALSPQDIVNGSHAMSVPYLRDQLARSLANLKLETVDLLYLHNAPEAQLEAVGKHLFFERLSAAFGFYENARARGRIGWYGLATWDSLRAGRTEAGYVSLEEIVELAEDVGGPEHGLGFIQFPFNLMMPEAAVLRNQMVKGERMTLFEAAHTLGLGTFSSVPLLQGQLTEGETGPQSLTAAQRSLQFARSAPHHIGALVGQKRATHVKENLSVANLPPLYEAEFREMLPH